jgi:type I restriction enzyme S subunit
MIAIPVNPTTVRCWKRYAEYRASALEWCDQIPAHWQVLPLKRIAVFESGENITAETIAPEGDFPVYGGNGLRGYTTAYTHSGHYVLIGRQGALCGNINYADGRFWASEHAVVVTPRQPVEVVWLGETLRTMNLGQYSISTAQPGLSVERVIQNLMLVPPLAEQHAIAAFLNRETARINALIGHKERLISLLEEKRQAVISHAATRGLDPAAPTKPTGLGWLESIPRTWEVRRNAVLFADRDERGRSDLPVLEVSIRSGVTVREFSTEHVEQQYEDPALYKRAARGDLVFNKMRMWQGAVGTAPTDGLVSPDYTVARPREGVNAAYFAQLFRTPWYMTEIDRYSHGMVKDRNRLYWDDFKQMPSIVPPVTEQTRILEHISRINGHSEAVMHKILEGIDCLKEYRTALITAAVTGQIDVRGEVTV